MNINGPITEMNAAINVFSSTKENQESRMLNAAMRVASYVGMIFAAAATVVLALGLAAICPAAGLGATALALGTAAALALGATVLLHDTYQVTKATEESLLGDTIGAKVGSFARQATALFSQKGSDVGTLEHLAKDTIVLKHLPIETAYNAAASLI